MYRKIDVNVTWPMLWACQFRTPRTEAAFLMSSRMFSCHVKVSQIQLTVHPVHPSWTSLATVVQLPQAREAAKSFRYNEHDCKRSGSPFWSNFQHSIAHRFTCWQWMALGEATKLVEESRSSEQWSKGVLIFIVFLLSQNLNSYVISRCYLAGYAVLRLQVSGFPSTLITSRLSAYYRTTLPYGSTLSISQ